MLALKTRCFEVLSRANVPTLEWTTDKRQAETWYREDGYVYARTVLMGHSGEGIVLCQSQYGDEVPNAPLYTRNYGTPFKEFRVHVVNGRIIDTTMKRRMSEEALREHNIGELDERERLQVRTYGNGWVFTRQGILTAPRIDDLAIQAARESNARMAAVDIVAKWRDGVCTDARVVEINSAPALRSETTLNAYTEALRPLVR
jgi:hypothetical protein